jgi:hypothetical protein
MVNVGDAQLIDVLQGRRRACHLQAARQRQPEPPAMLLMQAERQAALAAELGGGVLVEQCAQLQADLMNCQQVG